jgi:hypothetical protein
MTLVEMRRRLRPLDGAPKAGAVQPPDWIPKDGGANWTDLALVTPTKDDR